MSDAQDLSALTQEERSVTIGTTKVVVREVVMKDLRAFTAACAPFLKEFDDAGILAERRNKETGELEGMEEFALFQCISEHSEAFVLAASLVSNAPVAFLERLRPDQFFQVAALVVEVNGNFFVHRLAPQLIKFARAMGLVGLTLSSTSSTPGTDTPT